MLRGLSYDVGLTYISGPRSRRWTTHRPLPDPVLRRELRMVRSLGGDALRLHGERDASLLRAARAALSLGLEAWLSPRFIGLPSAQVARRVARLARGAEDLRADYPGRVTLVAANELTLDAPDFFPGDYEARGRAMGAVSALGGLRRTNLRLGRVLREIAAAAREEFSGPLTYAAGFWEEVGWKEFDFLSANLYRDWTNWWSYRDRLAALKRHRLPVFVTEFGAATHAGAPLLGGAGWHLSRPFARSEKAQAEAVEAQWREIAAAGLQGGFVYCFAMPRCFPGDRGETQESDKASFGIARVAGRRVVLKEAWRTVHRMFSNPPRVRIGASERRRGMRGAGLWTRGEGAKPPGGFAPDTALPVTVTASSSPRSTPTPERVARSSGRSRRPR